MTVLGSVLRCCMHHKIINVQLEKAYAIVSFLFDLLFVVTHAYNVQKSKGTQL